MAKENNLVKIIAAVGIVSILTSATVFSFYKAFSEVLDTVVNEILDFLSRYGIDLSVTHFWLILGMIFLFSAVIIIISSD